MWEGHHGTKNKIKKVFQKTPKTRKNKSRVNKDASSSSDNDEKSLENKQNANISNNENVSAKEDEEKIFKDITQILTTKLIEVNEKIKKTENNLETQKFNLDGKKQECELEQEKLVKKKEELKKVKQELKEMEEASKTLSTVTVSKTEPVDSSETGVEISAAELIEELETLKDEDQFAHELTTIFENFVKDLVKIDKEEKITDEEIDQKVEEAEYKRKPKQQITGDSSKDTAVPTVPAEIVSLRECKNKAAAYFKEARNLIGLKETGIFYTITKKKQKRKKLSKILSL